MPAFPPVTRVAAAAATLLLSGSVWAGAIDTTVLEGPWPKQRVHDTEVGRHAVRWRERASKQDGIFAGVHFTPQRGQEEVWKVANEYQDVGQMTPGVTAVRYLEQSDTHEKIAIDVKILWKSLTLTFDVEKEAPRIMRFRLVNEALGEYRGVCRFEPGPTAPDGSPSTEVELATWLKPAHPVPMRLLLLVERITMLQGARKFLDALDENSKQARQPASR